LNGKKPYVDTIVRDPKLGSVLARGLEDDLAEEFPQVGVVIGGFGKRAASQVAIWRKLIESLLELEPRELWFECDKDFLVDFLPRSTHALCFRAVEGFWDALRQEQGWNSFILITKSNGSQLSVLGLPTEEGLETLHAFFMA
jgi:hypothetical protein